MMNQDKHTYIRHKHPTADNTSFSKTAPQGPRARAGYEKNHRRDSAETDDDFFDSVYLTPKITQRRALQRQVLQPWELQQQKPRQR